MMAVAVPVSKALKGLAQAVLSECAYKVWF